VSISGPILHLRFRKRRLSCEGEASGQYRIQQVMSPSSKTVLAGFYFLHTDFEFKEYSCLVSNE
jgi:hypothetical protein